MGVDLLVEADQRWQQWFLQDREAKLQTLGSRVSVRLSHA
jgi:hypothetical protein